MSNEEPLPPDQPDADAAESFAEVPDPAGPPVPVEGPVDEPATVAGQLHDGDCRGWRSAGRHSLS